MVISSNLLLMFLSFLPVLLFCFVFFVFVFFFFFQFAVFLVGFVMSLAMWTALIESKCKQ